MFGNGTYWGDGADSVINSQIYEKAVDDDIAVWHATRFNYYLDYEVTYVSDSAISILFKNDNECYGVNYSLETGEEIKIGQRAVFIRFL